MWYIKSVIYGTKAQYPFMPELIKSTNPATLKVNNIYKPLPFNQALKMAEKSKIAFKEWKQIDTHQRADHFKELAHVLRKKKDEYAKLMTMEMGKPLKQALAEIEKCAWTSEVYADKGPQWLEEEHVKADGKKHVVTFEPL